MSRDQPVVNCLFAHQSPPVVFLALPFFGDGNGSAIAMKALVGTAAIGFAARQRKAEPFCLCSYIEIQAAPAARSCRSALLNRIA
jgi:hypothetical protein